MYLMPTEWEQDVAEAYVNERTLVRPSTNVKTALVAVLVFALATVVIVLIAYCVLTSIGVFASLPSSVQRFCDAYPFLSIVLLCVGVVAVELFFCFKHAVICAIKLYQRYAPEEIRRRCLFMPTCSEYTIMAVRKYGGIIGLCKGYYRLMYLCRGNIYKIHYP